MHLKIKKEKLWSIAITLLFLMSFNISLSMVVLIVEGYPPFSTNVKVNTDTGNRPQSGPKIALGSEGTIYAVWQDSRNWDDDIYFARSTDGGANWSDPNIRVNTDQDTALQFNPTLAIDAEGTLYVAWEDTRDGDRNIYFAKSKDGGNTWTDPNIRVNNDLGDFNEEGPSIAVDSGGTIYLVWDDNRNGDYDIYFAKSTDEGATWTEPNVRVNTDLTDTGQSRPTIAVDATGTIYVAWTDRRNGNSDIYLAYSTDGGSNWSDPNVKVNTDTTTSDQYSPNLVVDCFGTIHISWVDKRDGDADIYYAKSINKGADWTYPNVKVNTDFGTEDQFQPTIVVSSSGTIYAAWQDDGNDEYDILFAYSTDGGMTWSEPNLRVNDDSSGYAQSAPNLAVDSLGGVYIVWGDARDYYTSGYDIYFANLTAVATIQNNAPTITNKASASKTAIVNLTMTFNFIASDPDSDPLFWSKLSGPDWLVIGPSNGTIYGKPSTEDLGSNDFMIQVSDGKGGTDSYSFSITVQSSSNGGGDKQDGDSTDSGALWLILVIVIVIVVIVLLFFLIRKKK
ncbi:MAG: exo-alpha-sialidase [Thermoplasmata archaeon]|nr:MAG: exo-alpha-sialidase [Thermoplasmata archaeon]